MEPFSILLIIFSVALGAFLQGAVGLGLNLLAAPLLMLVEPRFVPGPVMAGALLLTILMVLRDREGIDLRGVGWMAAGMLPGSAIASLLLPVIPLKALSLTLGGGEVSLLDMTYAYSVFANGGVMLGDPVPSDKFEPGFRRVD